MTTYFKRALVLAVALSGGACTVKDTVPPPLAGPSEMSLSLAITANPEVVSFGSLTTIRVEARDQNGQSLRTENRARMRVEILADGVATDFGTLSSREVETGSNGRAEFTYTAPAFVAGTIPDVSISVTPVGTYAANDARNLFRRLVSIRLVPTGVIGNAPTANFTFTPPNPAAFQTVRFDGSSSVGGVGTVITNYVWDFGDGQSSTGATATHQYDTPGVYLAKLTVTDSNGFSSTSPAQTVTVGGGAAPTASFVFSPTSPSANAKVFFNGSGSTAGAGHHIVRYSWDFGDGKTGTGSTEDHTYTAAGAYNVVLTVTDEVGQTDQEVKVVPVASGGGGGGSGATASFTVTPASPTANAAVAFNASGSTGGGGSLISTYSWNFGCTAGVQCTFATGNSVVFNNTYLLPGTYQVTLTIVDASSNTASTTRTITVN